MTPADTGLLARWWRSTNGWLRAAMVTGLVGFALKAHVATSHMTNGVVTGCTRYELGPLIAAALTLVLGLIGLLAGLRRTTVSQRPYFCATVVLVDLLAGIHLAHWVLQGTGNLCR